MPSKRQRNGRTQWIAQINRKDFRKEQICASRKEALAWEQGVKRLLESGIPLGEIKRLLDSGVTPEEVPAVWEIEKTPLVSLLEWANDYLGYAQRFSDKTFKEKRDCMRGLLRYFGPNTRVDEISPGQALDYLQSHFKQRSGYAANKERKNLVAAWNWGIKYRGFPGPNPFQLVDKFPHDPKQHYVPSLEDFRKVLNLAEGQDNVLLLTFFHTGGRRGEIFGAKWEDVDFEGQRIRLKTRKRKGGSLEEDWIPMTDELAEALKNHKEHAINEWVFVAQELRHYGEPFKVRRHWPKNLCKRAGVKPFGCHGIRGLAGTVLAHENVPMKVIQDLLRHKNLSTTERYVRGLTSIRPYLKVFEGGRKDKEHQNNPTSSPTSKTPQKVQGAASNRTTP